MYTIYMSMHIIQKHIMRKLTVNTCLRYADIQPEGVEGNQFSYHLKTLIQQKLIKRCPGGYTLTPDGMLYTSSVTFETFMVRSQAKVATLVICKNDHGEYLTYHRKRQPFIGMFGFPYGKIHMGETVEQAAMRELSEKTGISATLTHRAIMYLLVRDEDTHVIAHTMFHIFIGSDLRGTPIPQTGYGLITWKTEKELLKEKHMPGVVEVLKLIKSKKPGLLFEEHEIVLKN